jgi:hypothetical protein
MSKRKLEAGHQWLMPVILATQEAEIRRIMAQCQPRQIICQTVFQKKPITKWTGGVTQVVVYLPGLASVRPLSSNPNTTKKKKKFKWKLEEIYDVITSALDTNPLSAWVQRLNAPASRGMVSSCGWYVSSYQQSSSYLLHKSSSYYSETGNSINLDLYFSCNWINNHFYFC